jgi:dipeptidyl aminopeptidase/acylaminoacyl peptidase
VFTASDGTRVPGFLALPEGPGPHPVVLLLHGGAGSKESWWNEDGFERGAGLTRALLESGTAVFALDGAHHGERAWWPTYRTMLTATARDYRIALDYLAGRPGLVADRVGAVGLSMGGVTATLLAAADGNVPGLSAGSCGSRIPSR